MYVRVDDGSCLKIMGLMINNTSKQQPYPNGGHAVQCRTQVCLLASVSQDEERPFLCVHSPLIAVVRLRVLTRSISRLRLDELGRVQPCLLPSILHNANAHSNEGID